MENDAALSARLAHDLDGTFPAVVAAHQDRIFTIALRLLGHRADAEEVAQDAFVRAYRALDGYDAERRSGVRLTPWLATIAVNLARNKRRRSVDRVPPIALPSPADGAPEPRDRASSPEELVLASEERSALGAALLGLPVAMRAPIVLRHVAGLSLAETALALDRPEGTVKAQVHRGLARLRSILEAGEAAPRGSSGSSPGRRALAPHEPQPDSNGTVPHAPITEVSR